eukprot:3732510-Prymnesium_polylepis.2
MYYAFIDDEYEGAVNCNVSKTCPRGFLCPDDTSGVVCYGRTGPQILDTFHLNYETIEADLDTGKCVLLLAAIGAVLKTAYVRT